MFASVFDHGFDRGFFITLHAIHRQLAGMPNDYYFIRLIHRPTRRPCPGERVWTAQDLLRGSVVRFLRARNGLGFDVYLLPYAEDGNAGYILLDLDHPTPRVLDGMRANGHEPCIVLQTSPGHLQAWIRVSLTPLPPAVATAVGQQLAHLYGGDLASTDWRHLGRLAGFTNQKFDRRMLRGRPPWVKLLQAHAVVAPGAEELLHTARQSLVPTLAPTPIALPARDACPAAVRSSAMTPQGACAVYQRWMQRWHIRERFPQPDWSIVDLWLARKLLAMHVPPQQVETTLRLGSPQFPRHHGDPEDYLRRTLARAALPTSPPVCSIRAPAPRARREPTD